MYIERFFDWLLHASAMASILVGVILFIKLLLKNKIGARWQYALWLVVIIRLIIPFDIQATFSIFNLIDKVESIESTQIHGIDIVGKINNNNETNIIPPSTIGIGKNTNGNQVVTPNPTTNTNNQMSNNWENQEGNSSIDRNQSTDVTNPLTLNILSIIWMIGVILLTIYTLIINLKSYFRIKREPQLDNHFISEYLEDCKIKMGIRRKIPIILTSELNSPSLMGAFYPRLLIPKKLLGKLKEEDFKYVIIHELSHYKRKDLLINWMTVGLQLLHWFNPILWIAFHYMRRDCELATDEKALSYMKLEERVKYGHTLINLTAYFSKPKWLPATTGFLGGKNQLRRRLTMIKLFSKNSYRWSLLGLIVIVTVGAIGLTSAKDTSSNMNSEPFTNIVVNGDATRSSFSSVDFVDADTGWMVKSQYNSYHQDSQILKTENGGETWSTINLKGLNITKLKFIDKLRGWAIAEVNETSQSNEETNIRILYTKDGGESWDIQWENKMKPYYGYDLQFYGENHGYALINGLLLTTEDGGSKWSPATYDVKNFTPQHMSFTDASNGWVIGAVNYTNNMIVLRTKDGGKHWQGQFSHQNKDQSIGTIDIQFINQTTGWFLTSNMDTWMGDLYYTSDGGESWQSIHQIKSVRPSPRELYFVTPKIGWIPLDVGAGPISGGLLYTKDGGKNFDVINNDSSMISMKEVDFISENEGWAIGSYPNIGDYLIHTNDGGKTWTQVYPKIRPTKDISFIDNQHGFGIGQNSNQDVILYTKDSGETWNEIQDFSDQYRLSKLSFIDAKNGYVLGEVKSTGKIVILQTMDGGVTWDSLNGNYPQEQLWSLEYFKFFDSDHGLMISPKGDKVVFYRTEDGGYSWRGIEQDKSVMKSSVQYSFISSQEGWMAYNTLINSSKNSKATYGINLYQNKKDVDAQRLGELGSNNYLYGIYFISEDKGWMIEQEPPFKGEFHLMVTDDGGKTWTSHPFPTGFQLNLIQNQLPMQFTDEQHGWILSAEGLLTTNDGGRTWNWKE